MSLQIETQKFQFNNDVVFLGAVSASKLTDYTNSRYLNLTGGTITGDLTVNGTLLVKGSSVNLSATNLEVNDPLIYIAQGNVGNIYDIGIVGHFNDGVYQHTGLVRRATTKEWSLFSGVTSEPLSSINWNDSTFKYDILNANFKGTLTGNVSGSISGSTGLFSTSVSSRSISAANFYGQTGTFSTSVSSQSISATNFYGQTGTFSTSVSSPSISAASFYGDGSKITGIVTGLTALPAIATFSTSVSSPSISAANFYGQTGTFSTSVSSPSISAANFYGQTGTFSTSVSSPSISATNFYGFGNQVILSDGFNISNVGNGANTLSLNFVNGVYVGLSGSNQIYALGVPKYTTLQSTASSITSGMPYFYYVYPTSDYLVSAGQYEIEYVLYYLTNAATAVTYSLSSTNQLAFISSNYVQTSASGITTNATATNAAALSAFSNGVNLPSTATLTSGTSANVTIKTYLQTSVSATNVVLNINLVSGSITPLQGSYRKITRIM